MSNVVEYILSLRDNLSGQLNTANAHAKQLESSMGGIKTMATSIGSALGIGFAVFEGMNFVKKGVEKFKELEEETAKVRANLESTGGIAGVSMKNIEDYSKSLSGKIHASRVDIMDMASQLLTFPAITKDTFQTSMGLVADIAKQTGHGLSETAIMYGKALNNPTEGLQKMMRYGVMFTDAEKDKITKLQESGKLIEAQKFMIDAIAHSGYAGVAEAMFNADPIVRFNKMMGGAQVAIGEIAVDALRAIMPYLEKFASMIKSTANFLKQYKDYITPIVMALGITGLTGVMISLTSSTISWAAALWATGIPEIVIGVSALIAGIIALNKHFSGFRSFLFGLNEVVKNFGKSVMDTLRGLYEMINGIANFDLTEIKKGFNRLTDVFTNNGRSAAEAWNKGWQDGKKSFQGDDFFEKEKKVAERIAAMYDKSTEKAQKYSIINFSKSLESGLSQGLISKDQQAELLSLLPSKAKNGINTQGAKPSTEPIDKTTGKGSKNVNVTVTYNAPLIKDFTIETNTVEQGLDNLKEKLSAILVGATHDALMVADY